MLFLSHGGTRVENAKNNKSEDEFERHRRFRSDTILAYAAAIADGVRRKGNRAKRGERNFFFTDVSGNIEKTLICGEDTSPFCPVISPRKGRKRSVGPSFLQSLRGDLGVPREVSTYGVRLAKTILYLIYQWFHSSDG